MFIHVGRSARAAGALAALLCGLFAIGSAGASTISGGGPRSSDCLTVFQSPAPVLGNSHQITSTDGDASCGANNDPSCDADADVNGECQFQVAVCANSTADPACTLSGVRTIFVDHSADNGDPKFDTSFQALQSRIDNEIQPPTSDSNSCTGTTNIVVKLRGPFSQNRCRANHKTIRITTTSEFIGGHQVTDVDTLRLTCRPTPESCDPAALFSGTLDRIQKQVFNQNCALSGCHDSQTQQAGLLLEVGASHDALVGVVPTNLAAQMLGWKRVNVTGPNSGDPDTSFLFHKITGDLGPGLDARMPFGRQPLPANLIEIIRLWIVAGAPPTGWVPGTDS
jgi:hypothetical protein